MYYEELYEKAYSGDLSALKELESKASADNAQAQFVLSPYNSYGNFRGICVKCAMLNYLL